MAATDARPVPRKNVAYRVTFPIFDNDGDPVPSGAGLDSEISLDQAAFSDCTSESIFITGSVGLYYLDLTAAEMNADTVAIQVKTTTTDAKTTILVMYPEESGDYRANIVQVTGANLSNNVPLFGANVVNNMDKTGYLISGTLNSLDVLDTAQDSQHSTTQSTVSTINTNVSSLLNIIPYYAKIDLTIDSANSQDEYTVQWFSGVNVLTTGVTSPTINVINRSGSTLITTTGMTQIGSTHAFYYNEPINRITSGDAVIATAVATIGGASRTWRNLLSRDK